MRSAWADSSSGAGGLPSPPDSRARRRVRAHGSSASVPACDARAGRGDDRRPPHWRFVCGRPPSRRDRLPLPPQLERGSTQSGDPGDEGVEDAPRRGWAADSPGRASSREYFSLAEGEVKARPRVLLLSSATLSSGLVFLCLRLPWLRRVVVASVRSPLRYWRVTSLQLLRV